MTMILRYELSKSEFCRAHRAHLRSTLVTLKNLGLLTLALLLGLLQAQALGPQSWATRLFGLIWLGVVGFIAYAYWMLPPRLFNRLYRSSPETEIELISKTSDNIEIKQGHSRRRLKADAITHVSRQNGLLLIHPKDGVPIVIPERALASDEDQETLRLFLARSL